jgi:F-type H+-transporting ATPase subunit delta
MKVSKEAKKGARMIFDAARLSGHLDEEKVRKGVAAILEKRPAGCAQILHELSRLVRLEVDKRSAWVETAVSLSEQEKGAWEISLKAKFGKDTLLHFSINPGLIAGTRVRIGSDVYNANVRERLVRLRAEMAE